MRGLGVLVALLAACGPTSGGVRGPAAPLAANGTAAVTVSEAAPTVTLAVIPVEPEGHPGLISLINQAMRSVVLPGVDRTIVSPIPLETAQLAVECVDATTDCYYAVGKSLAASRLLFGKILASKKGFKVRLTLFDVEKRAELRTIERPYANDHDAEAQLDETFAELVEAAR